MLPLNRNLLNPGSFPPLKPGQDAVGQMQAKMHKIVPFVVVPPSAPVPVTPIP